MPLHINSDAPITAPDEDRLGRVGLAKQIVDQIFLAPTDHGMAIGLLGPWGTGKTSILNIVEHMIAQEKPCNTVIVRFNPWMFSGTEQLISRFFSEVASELKIKGGNWAKTLSPLLESYGDLLKPMGFIPVVGSGLSLFGQVLSAGGKFFLKRHQPVGIDSQRKAIIDELNKFIHRFLFILDDIDRLSDDEIRIIMKLVRLVGDFPKCTYLLAFDRERVERALGGDHAGDGRAYLEKILQFVNVLPPARNSDLSKILLEGIGQNLEGLQCGPFDQHLWQNIFLTGMFPLFKKMRDVNRYLNSLPAIFSLVGKEVATVDVLALESIRVLRPDLFSMLPGAIESLTRMRNTLRPDSGVEERAKIESILHADGEDRTGIERMFTRLFPGCSALNGNVIYGPEHQREWSRQRRVAHERMLRFYLEYSYPQEIMSNTLVQRCFDALGDEEELGLLLASLSDVDLEQVVERLGDFEDEYPVEAIESACRTFLKELRRLPGNRNSFVDLPPELKLYSLFSRLLKGHDTQVVQGIVCRIIRDSATSLRGKFLIIRLVGYREDSGFHFVSVEMAETLEKEFRTQIVEANPRILAEETELNRLVHWIEETGDDSEKAKLRSKMVDSALFNSVLTSCLSESMSRAIGDVAVTREKLLDWEILEKYVGSSALHVHLDSLSEEGIASLPPLSQEAISLAKRYLSGWRPGRRSGR